MAKNISNLDKTSSSNHTHNYAAESHGTHVTYSTAAPKVAGTASVGSASSVSRGDHVHPAQTSVSGNAGTATKLATARTLTIGSTGKTFDGSGNVAWSLSEIGAAAASHGTHLTIGTGASNAAAGNHTHNYAASSHKHGLLHDNFTVEVASTTTDNGWSMINSSYNGYLLKSMRFGANVPPWAAGGYGAGIAFGGGDTKGVMSMQYSSPLVKFAGGNGTKPVWNIGITGTSGTNYNLDDLNSLGGQLTLANGNIGTLSSLQTSNKGNLVAAINEVFQSGANAKQKLVDALNANEISCSTSESWDDLIDKLNNLNNKYTTIDEELLLLDKGTEYNTGLSGGIWTAAGIALTSGTGLVITPQSGKYKSFTFRNKIILSNYTALEITVKCPAGSTEIGFVIDDTSELGGTYSSYGNATTTRPHAISTPSSYAGGTETYIFNFAELYDRTGISFDRSLYIGFAFGYASGNYTITNIKLRNNRTVPNKMNIISAASLPATGEEGQICVITDNPVDSFMMSSDFNDVTTGENSIVLYLGNTATGNATEGTLVKIVNDNLTMNYYFVKVCQGENRLNSYIYQNGAWKSLTQSAIYFIENGVERNNSYFGGVMASSKGWSFYNDNEKGLVAHGNTGYNEKFCTPNNKINFSLYNYIEVKASVSDGSYTALTLGIGTTDETRGYQFPCNTSYNSIDVGYATSKYITKSFNSTSGQTLIYNISSWTGEGYLVIHCSNGGYGRYFRILDMKFY